MTNEIERRSFLAGSLAAAATVSTFAGSALAAPDDEEAKSEFYEWRRYACVDKEKHQLTNEYLREAFVPALRRAGARRVGAFTSLDEVDDNSIHLFIAYSSLETLGSRNLALADDEQYQKAAAEYFSLPRAMPPYSRIENRLMRAFDGMPAIELPAASKAGKPRIFELRIYESHNEHKARRKVEMFNDGEIDIMRDVELGPVFFGETLVSNDMPNLTYMLSADDLESHKKHWDAFRVHPEWQRMKKLKKYKDTVSKITSIMLKPTEYSQV